MTYADKTLSCRDCGQAFVFTSGEQEFHAMKGFNNEPSRCPDVGQPDKASRGDTGGYSSGGYSSGKQWRRRRIWSLRPTRCIPPYAQTVAMKPASFQPRGDKPVYCSDCFSKQRGAHTANSRTRVSVLKEGPGDTIPWPFLPYVDKAPAETPR